MLRPPIPVRRPQFAGSGRCPGAPPRGARQIRLRSYASRNRSALVDLAADSGESSFANDRPALLKEAGSILDRNRDFTSRTRALYFLAMGNAVVDKDIAKSGEYAARAVQLLRRYPPSLDLV